MEDDDDPSKQHQYSRFAIYTNTSVDSSTSCMHRSDLISSDVARRLLLTTGEDATVNRAAAAAHDRPEVVVVVNKVDFSEGLCRGGFGERQATSHL